MRVLWKGGTIDEFLGQPFLVFLDQRGVRYCDGDDSEITRESTKTFESRQYSFTIVFLRFVRKFSKYFQFGNCRCVFQS